MAHKVNGRILNYCHCFTTKKYGSWKFTWKSHNHLLPVIYKVFAASHTIYCHGCTNSLTWLFLVSLASYWSVVQISLVCQNIFTLLAGTCELLSRQKSWKSLWLRSCCVNQERMRSSDCSSLASISVLQLEDDSVCENLLLLELFPTVSSLLRSDNNLYYFQKRRLARLAKKWEVL